MDPSHSPQSSTPKANEANGGPLPAYELFLRALGDNYLNFFGERLRLEEQYRNGMLKLLARQRAVDSMFDERLPDRDWTLRRAWKEVLDSLERESDVRGAFINSLRADIVNPLYDLKETHERSRKRIKEDIKSSFTQYTDYMENALPRLKRAYFKRFQEMEEWKAAVEGVRSPTNANGAMNSPPISNPISSRQGRSSLDAGLGNSSGISAAAAGAERIRGRQASIALHTYHGRRDRSPGSGGGPSFSDLAHQGRRQLNSLRTLIETKGVVKEGGARTEAAMRGIKAKRDAEEADKEYRKGVHALETLRLRRVKILEAGYMSLETLVNESAEMMVKVLTRYADNLTATNRTASQLSTTLHSTVPEIQPATDLVRLRHLTSTSLAASIPRKVLYDNYIVGECADMIFGVSLLDYASSRGLREGEVPKLVDMCIGEVERRGLGVEGIYRVSGKHTTVQELALAAEKSEEEFTVEGKDIFAVGSLLKYYLRELPEPVFKFPQAERTQYTEDREKHLANSLSLIRGKLRRLPPVHQATLRAMLEHLSKVAENAKSNKMDAKNLAVVFGPVLLGEDPIGSNVDILTMSKDTLMEDLITHARLLYDTPPIHYSPLRSSSPPLPLPPSDEYLDSKSASAIYGSAHTKVKTLPPNDPLRITPLQSQHPPKLPPRRGAKPNLQGRRTAVSSGSVSDSGSAPSVQRSSRPSEDGRATKRNGGKLRLETEGKTRSANASGSGSPITKDRDRPNRSDVVLGLLPGEEAPPFTPSTATSTTGDASASGTEGGKDRVVRKSSSIYANSLLMEPGVLMVQESDPEYAQRGAPSLKRDAPLKNPSSTSVGTSGTCGTTASNAIGGSTRGAFVTTSTASTTGAVAGTKKDEELRGEEEVEGEVDYPGSPDTSALEWRTAENTPVTESIPLDSSLGHLDPNSMNANL